MTISRFFTPADFPNIIFSDPGDVQKLIESFEEFNVIVSSHPEVNIKMIDFMDQKLRDLLEAHGKITGVIA